MEICFQDFQFHTIVIVMVDMIRLLGLLSVKLLHQFMLQILLGLGEFKLVIICNYYISSRRTCILFNSCLPVLSCNIPCCLAALLTSQSHNMSFQMVVNLPCFIIRIHMIKGKTPERVIAAGLPFHAEW